MYLVDNIIDVLNNWGQAVTYKNDKKLCCLNNDRNSNKYELNDVNDKNNIIIIFCCYYYQYCYYYTYCCYCYYNLLLQF